MSDIQCRIDGRAGRITLNRPKALNALTHDMRLGRERGLGPGRRLAHAVARPPQRCATVAGRWRARAQHVRSRPPRCATGSNLEQQRTADDGIRRNSARRRRRRGDAAAGEEWARAAQVVISARSQLAAARRRASSPSRRRRAGPCRWRQLAAAVGPGDGADAVAGRVDDVLAGAAARGGDAGRFHGCLRGPCRAVLPAARETLAGHRWWAA